MNKCPYCPYWTPGVFRPECRPLPWLPPPTNTLIQLQSGPACSESSGRTRRAASTLGSQSSPAAETYSKSDTKTDWDYTDLLIESDQEENIM